MDGKYKTNKFAKTTMHCLFTQCSLLSFSSWSTVCHLSFEIEHDYEPTSELCQLKGRHWKEGCLESTLFVNVSYSQCQRDMSELCDVCTCGGDAVSPHLEKQGRGDEARAHLRCSFALYPSNVEHKADSSSVTSLPTCSQKLIKPQQIVPALEPLKFPYYGPTAKLKKLTLIDSVSNIFANIWVVPLLRTNSLKLDSLLTTCVPTRE